jgi:hypothetical protein
MSSELENRDVAVEQSDHIIFDLRHFKGNENDSVTKLQREFKMRHNIQELLIIKKNGELIALSKNVDI